MRATDFERHNPNYVGGAITGGVSDLFQTFTRPVARSDPYSTPNRKLFICSASTPPGGGVHGMCGYHAAQSVLRRLGKTKNKAPRRHGGRELQLL
jgi:phytoene dehydrogenase-like protein